MISPSRSVGEGPVRCPSYREGTRAQRLSGTLNYLVGTASGRAAAPATCVYGTFTRALGSHGHGTRKVKSNSLPDPRPGASNPPAFPKQTRSIGGPAVSTAAFQTDMGPCFAFLFGRAIRQAGVPGNPGWEPLLESNTITSSKCVQSQGAPTDARHFTQRRKC